MVQGDEEAQEAGLEVARTMLAPSNMASQMRPDLHPAKAAHAYVTGGREAVPPEVLRDALVFLEYSNASYYIEVGTPGMQSCTCLLSPSCGACCSA